MAFSERIRNRMKRRANGIDEITGTPIVGRGECAHDNHDRSAPEYDTEDNGWFVNLITHWWLHHVNDEVNGLNEAQNDWSKERIKERIEANGGLTEEQWAIFGRWWSEYD